MSTDHVTSTTGPFAIVPEWLLYAEVSDRAIRLYAVLHRHEGPNGIYPSKRRLGALLDCSAGTVERTLDELRQAGAIVVEVRHRPDGGQTSNRYLLCPVIPVGQGGDHPPIGGGGITRDPPRTRASKNDNPDPTDQVDTDSPAIVKAIRSKLTEDVLEQLVTEFSPRLRDPRAAIDAARGHRGFGFAVDQLGFVRRWLERDVEAQAKRGPQRPAQRGGTTRAAATSSDSQRYPSAASGRFFDV